MAYQVSQAISAMRRKFAETDEYVGAAGRVERRDVIELSKAAECRRECTLVESGLEPYFATNAFQVLDSF